MCSVDALLIGYIHLLARMWLVPLLLELGMLEHFSSSSSCAYFLICSCFSLPWFPEKICGCSDLSSLMILRAFVFCFAVCTYFESVLPGKISLSFITQVLHVCIISTGPRGRPADWWQRKRKAISWCPSIAWSLMLKREDAQFKRVYCRWGRAEALGSVCHDGQAHLINWTWWYVHWSSWLWFRFPGGDADECWAVNILVLPSCAVEPVTHHLG